ncbi:hypothetical protein [Burkholderia cenocepacia]|nr:hypothetical protein [Burkholderia cenocepacia]
MRDAVLTDVYDIRMGTVAHPMGDGRIGFPVLGDVRVVADQCANHSVSRT